VDDGDDCADGVDNDADASVDLADSGCIPDGDNDGVPDASDACPSAPGLPERQGCPYDFSGFFSPVDNTPMFNSVKAGAGVPVKLSLNGDQGLSIFATGYPKSQWINCDTSAPLDAIEETVSTGSSGLSYDPIADQYVYVWKSEKAWAGTCRQLMLRLNDLTDHVANFRFK
jgi:hypothetical protein